MTIPSTNDYPQYTNKPLDDADWLNMTQATVSAETDGTKDFTVNSLTTTNGITAGTSVTAATAVVTGAVTAGSFVGDGSGLTNTSINQKNFLINGDARLNSLAAYTLVNNTYSDKNINGVNFWEAMASGTAVNAGTFTSSSTSLASRTGYGFHISAATITGTGIVYLRYRMQSKDAVNFIGQKASFSCKVYHDVATSINYTVTIRKANSADNFAAVTVIQTGTATSIASATETALKLENITMATCGNGVEIEIKAECGAITTKNFYFSELQFELSTAATTYEYTTYESIIPLATKSMRLIYSNTLTAPATNVSISSLTGYTDKEYRLVTHIIANTTGSTSLFATLNSDTGNNYNYLRSENINGVASASESGVASNINLGILQVAGVISSGNFTILTTTGQYKHLFGTSFNEASDGSPYELLQVGGMWSNNANELTSIQVVGSAANALGTGSTIKLYACR